MKTFEQILGMTQTELKNYLKKFLLSKKYEVVEMDGFLYAKGTVPVLLTAHMDRHPSQGVRVTEIQKLPILKGEKVETHWTSPQGICGDDRCGVWAIMNLIKEHHVSVLFCEDEEIGCVGSRKFCKTDFIKNLDVNFMVQIDRHGSSDLVFYSNDNKEFQKWCEDVTGYKTAIGTCSDISNLMPASEIAGVNISCGYYGEHSKTEYIVIEELENTIDAIKLLIEEKVDEVWKYEAKKYTYYGNGWGNGLYRNSYKWYDDDDYDYYGGYYSSKSKSYSTTTKKNKFKSDTDVELTVYLDESECGYDKLSVTGATKPECWMNLFMTYDDLSFGMICDYEYN